MFSNRLILEFCSLWIAEVLSQETNPQTNPLFYGVSKVDCSSFIPTQVSQMMQQSDSSVKANNIVPLRYLQDCLNGKVYNKYLAPYEFIPPSTSWSLGVGMAVSQFVSLDTIDNLQLKVSVELSWNDPRFMWNVPTNLSTWQWPTKMYLPASRLWSPEINVLTCELESCSITINPDSFVDISNDGTVEARDSFLLTSSCMLDFTYFPFDNQTCAVNMLINFPGYEDSRIQIQILNSDETDFIHGNEQWDITSVNFYSAMSHTYKFQESSPSNWILTQVPVSNHTLFLVLAFRRTSSYYVSNIIAPLMVIVGLGLCTLILPPDAIERCEVTLAVVLAFVFYQTIVATQETISGNTVLLGEYINWSFATLAAFLVCATFVLRLIQLDSNKAPPVCISVFLIRPIRWLMNQTRRLCCRCGRCCRCTLHALRNEKCTAIVTPSSDLRSQSMKTNDSSKPFNSGNTVMNPNSSHIVSESESTDNVSQEVADSAKKPANGSNQSAQFTQRTAITSTSNMSISEAKEMSTVEKFNQPGANKEDFYKMGEHSSETWGTLAIYIHVLTCAVFVCSNVALFCAYIVPILVVGIRNNATPIYYNTSIANIK